MSQLGWIAFSPDDRNKVRTVLALLAEKGTLDELGIGQIRDAFSDLLFPGISTIQTRAKYFITVPRILRDYQNLTSSKKRSYKSLQKYLYDRENEIAKILVSVHDESIKGIIGRTRVETGGVSRHPSEAYWNGLRTFSLVKTKLSLTEFCHQLERSAFHIGSAESDHNEDSDDTDSLKSKQLIQLPDQVLNWNSQDNLKIQLSHKEGEFLKAKMSETPGIELTVAAQLFKHHLVDKVLVENANTELSAFDELTGIMLIHEKVDSECKRRLQLASEFSLAIEGPHIRYNIMLAKNNDYEDSVDKYEQEYEEWLDDTRSKNIFKEGCEDEWITVSDEVNRTIKHSTRSFVKQWCEALRQNVNHEQLNKIVSTQAIRNKGERSLLKRKLANNQWMGIRRLDFRWGTARTIIQDIQDGLKHADT